MWRCARCKRSFTRVNQGHTCGSGDASEVVRQRSPSIVALYRTIESFARRLGKVEIVARERYVLLRSIRIFADLVIMKDAVRLALHLGRQVEHPLFFKVVVDRRHITHVAKLTTKEHFAQISPLLKEAYDFSLAQRRTEQA